MRVIVDNSYLNCKKSEIYKAKVKLKKISIDEVLDNITKSCWNYNIQYKIILKNPHMLLMELTGERKKFLFKYHKKDKVLLKDYEEFLNCLEGCNVHRGIYITTGFFEEQINKYEANILFKKVQKIDVIKFIKKQLDINRISFLEYLP